MRELEIQRLSSDDKSSSLPILAVLNNFSDIIFRLWNCWKCWPKFSTETHSAPPAGPSRRADVYLSKVPVPVLSDCDTLWSSQPDLFTCGELVGWVAGWKYCPGAPSPSVSGWCKLLPGPASSPSLLSSGLSASPEAPARTREVCCEDKHRARTRGRGRISPSANLVNISSPRHISRHSQCRRPILICWLNITHTHWTSQIISVISARYFSYFQHIECPYRTGKYLLMNQNIHAVVSNMSIWRI